MKSILLIVGMMLTCVTASFAQQKVDKYCVVVMNYHGFKARPTFFAGNVDSLFSFKDSTIINNLVRVKELKSVPDVLNYMSSIGWTLVGTPTGWGYIYFRRSFDLSELAGH